MRKTVCFLLCILALVACSTASNKVSSTDLLHHNFILTKYDNKNIKVKGMQFRLEFGEKMFVSASICHTFSGFGSLKNNILKVDVLSVTDHQSLNTQPNEDASLISCQNPLDNELDHVIHKMLREGVHIKLDKNVLELKSESHNLVYVLRDWVY